MSFIKHLKAEEINIASVEHEELVNACTELQDIMGLNPAYDPAFDEKKTAEWLSEAMDEVCASDHLSDDSKAALRGVGYVFPGDDDYQEDDDEQEEVCEAAEIPQETESNGKEDQQKPVKKTKKVKVEGEKAEKPKKEPKPKKAKEPKVKEPKAPGVIETLRQFVRANGEKGFTIADAHAHVVELFPNNEPKKLLATCRVQLQNSRMGKEIGYLFATAVNEDKTRTIYARPLKEGETIPTKADKPKAEKPAKVKVRKAKKEEAATEATEAAEPVDAAPAESAE